MAETEFEYAGERYTIGPMDVFSQADLAAKLAPLLVPFAQLAKDDGTTEALMALRVGEDLADGVVPDLSETRTARSRMIDLLFGNLEKLTGLIAKMSKEDRREVMETCFAVVKKYPKGAQIGQHIWNAQAGRMQFDDLNTLPAALAICGHVITDKLSSFFAASR